MNHNNWLLSDRDELFLVDWEGAMIADPAIDIGNAALQLCSHNNNGLNGETYGVQGSLNLINV